MVLALLLSQPSQQTCLKADETARTIDLRYPLGIAALGDKVYIVDLELPGIWLFDGDIGMHYCLGANRLGEPLNRPRCVAIHPGGGILVGDTGTREIYHIPDRHEPPKPLTGGRVGVPMSIAVSPDNSTIFVADAERKAVLAIPIEGGEPVESVHVNARGLAFDHRQNLWAVTPEDGGVHRIDLRSGTTRVVVTGRPFKYANGLAWSGEYGWVTDGYGNCIWRFNENGEIALWHAGPPLKRPVGITSHNDEIWITDPKANEVYRIDPLKKMIEKRF